MRVTAKTKAATRSKILGAAQKLFTTNGFEATTTRQIAQVARIATGTLFNYFPTKEAVMASLASDALGTAISQFNETRRGAGSFEEELFSLIALELRQLKPLRKHLPSLLETSLSPLAIGSSNEAALRVAHLETITDVATGHGYGELSPVALQLYWTLYTGILMFWASDKSPKQEDTLALVDHSLNMFVGWLSEHAESQATSDKKRGT